MSGLNNRDQVLNVALLFTIRTVSLHALNVYQKSGQE